MPIQRGDEVLYGSVWATIEPKPTNRGSDHAVVQIHFMEFAAASPPPQCSTRAPPGPDIGHSTRPEVPLAAAL